MADENLQKKIALITLMIRSMQQTQKEKKFVKKHMITLIDR